VTTTIKLRGGTAAAWAAVNPVLAAREAGLELDTSRIKVGDGATAWASLPYYADGPIAMTWDGATYQPAALHAVTTRPKVFTGPVDPATVSGVVLALLDTWNNTA
jgi:hypothetical protein